MTETPEVKKVQYNGHHWHWMTDEETGERTYLRVPYTYTAHMVRMGHGTKTHYVWPNTKGEVRRGGGTQCYSSWKTGVSQDYGIITDPEQVTCEKCRKDLRKRGDLK
jgi:hypothetical protein